jgi:hypothetical protein
MPEGRPRYGRLKELVRQELVLRSSSGSEHVLESGQGSPDEWRETFMMSGPKSGRKYWINHDSKQMSWRPPQSWQAPASPQIVSGSPVRGKGDVVRRMQNAQVKHKHKNKLHVSASWRTLTHESLTPRLRRTGLSFIIIEQIISCCVLCCRFRWTEMIFLLLLAPDGTRTQVQGNNCNFWSKLVLKKTSISSISMMR